MPHPAASFMQPPRFRLPPPPPEAHSFRSDVLDEVRAHIAQSDGEHSRVVHGAGPLGFERHVVYGTTAALAWGRAGLGQTIRGALGMPVFHLLIDGGSTYTFGRRKVSAGPGTAVFIAGNREFTRRGGPGVLFAIGVAAAALDRELGGRMPGAAGEWAPAAEALDLSGVRKPAIEAAITDLAAAIRPGSPPALLGLAEAQLISLLTDFLVTGAAVTRSTPLARARLADLESWIDSHLDEPITVGRLCRAAGVGARSVELTFASLRGVSPMRFVAERRLAAVRRRLLRAGEGIDVTRAAIAAGFVHLGRFATLYRELYGEAPSQTLRRETRRARSGTMPRPGMPARPAPREPRSSFFG